MALQSQDIPFPQDCLQGHVRRCDAAQSFWQDVGNGGT